MNRAWKILALSAAGVLLTNSIKPDMTFIRPQKTKRNTVSAFAERIMNAETPSVPFCSLRFSERDQQLYRDGVPVGQEYAECSVRNGSLVISADGEDSLTPQEAAERIGCEVTAENGDLTIRFPFRTARLIVKSGQEPKLYGHLDLALQKTKYSYEKVMGMYSAELRQAEMIVPHCEETKKLCKMREVRGKYIEIMRCYLDMLSATTGDARADYAQHEMLIKLIKTEKYLRLSDNDTVRQLYQQLEARCYRLYQDYMTEARGGA